MDEIQLPISIHTRPQLLLNSGFLCFMYGRGGRHDAYKCIPWQPLYVLYEISQVLGFVQVLRQGLAKRSNYWEGGQPIIYLLF